MIVSIRFAWLAEARDIRCGTAIPEFAPVLENLHHMWWAIQRYPHPHHITFDRGDDGRVVNVSQRPADAEASMDVETGSAASSTTRRPKAKARPRQPTVLTEVMLIRYDNPRNLAEDVARRRGKFLACGVEIAEMGLASQDAVGKLIEELADIRDRQLPQCGDLPKFATDVETGRYVNEGYTVYMHCRPCENLMPLEGAQFIHRDWGEVKACRQRDLTRDVWKTSWWALGRLQIDLRHHIGRVSGSTTLDGRDSVTLHDIIKCDEGGWVNTLLRGDVPWIPWRKNAKVAVEPSGVIPCILRILDTGSRKDPTFHDRKKIPATCRMISTPNLIHQRQ